MSTRHDPVENHDCKIKDEQLQEAQKMAYERLKDETGWLPHTPGDPMPCDPMDEVYARFRDGSVLRNVANEWWGWGKADGPEEAAGEIVAWKPLKENRGSAKEYTGGSVSYYKVEITKPTSPEIKPYTAECNDIIEVLGMTYAEGNAFKAIWRSCAARTLGKSKDGYKDGVYDAEKVVFFGQRMAEAAKK